MTVFVCAPTAQVYGGATAVLVSAEGSVQYESEGKPHNFTQQFVLLEQDGVWKIASDCFRFLTWAALSEWTSLCISPVKMIIAVDVI